MIGMTLTLVTFFLINVVVTFVIHEYSKKVRSSSLRERRNVSLAITGMMTLIAGVALLILTDAIDLSGSAAGWLIVGALGIPTLANLWWLAKTVRGQW